MIILKRIKYGEKETLGYMTVFPDKIKTGEFNSMYPLATLELPWKDNQNNISCIPEGSYKLHPHNSPKFGQCLWVKEVRGRSEILIHVGNYYTDIRGCILPGLGFSDINQDGIIDVYSSQDAMNRILSKVTEPTRLEII